jgi:signal transduction histidine kinase/ActR/RegA family two-component response regulator
MSVRPPEFQAPVEGMPSETLLSGAAMAASIHAGAGWDTQPKDLAPAAASWLDKLPGGVFQLHRDVDGRWTFPYVNAEAQRLLGMSASGLRRDARSVRAVLHADDLAQLKLRLDQSRETGVAWKARFRLVRQNGPQPWVEITATPESLPDTSTVWNGFLLDVNYEQHRLIAVQDKYERHADAVHACELGVIEVDTAAKRVRLDLQARHQHGLDAQQGDISLSHWLDMLRSEDRDAALRMLNTDEHAADPSHHDTLVVQLGSVMQPRSRTLEITLARGKVADSDDGHPVPRLGLCRDITAQQQKLAERSYQHASELAERSRSEFLSRISHELRTPLNGVLGYGQLMALDREHPLPRTQAQRLNVLQECSARLLSMIDQLLEVSGIEQGHLELHPEVVDLRPLIARCVQTAAPLAQARDIRIEVSLGEEDVDSLGAIEPAHVRADPLALEQVINALLSNAIKYNRSPGRVRIRFVKAEMGTVLIDDTGEGLSTEQLSQLFQPLNRLGAERTRVPGHGLGLTTARKLTQAMGGKLKAWSQLGTGSRFAVSLALAKPDRPVGAPESDFAGLVPSQFDGGMQRVVLYVEDDEVNTTLMEQVFLMRPEWRLVTAATGEEGVAAALTHLPELALIDIGLPGISGIEVMQKIKGDLRTQDIHCVALSADTSAEPMARAKAAGFEDYWTKPFDIVGMVTHLKTLLGQNEAHRQSPE